MNVRLTKPEEQLRTQELFALAFGIPMERGEEPEPDEALHWAAFDEDGEMMSTLTVPDFTIGFDGQLCRMGGIGGVATLPQYRRRGGIRGCFEALLPELYRREYDFSYLYPFSTCFYRQFGYENCIQKQSVQVDLSLLKRTEVSGFYRLAEPGRDLREDVRAVDRVWERTYNLAVQHNDAFYDWVLKLDPAVKQQFCYVWYRADGTPGAYAVYRMQEQSGDRNLVCSRFHFLDREGFRALLNLFRGFAADYRYVKFEIPDRAELRFLMPEWSLGAASWKIVPAGMVRVIRVAGVLEKACYAGSGRAVLEVSDPQIAENNGCFAVTFADGRAVRVEKCAEKPDAILTIPAFSSLIAGTCDFSEAAQWMDGLTVRNPAAPLERIFYRKHLFIDDYF